MDRSSNDKFLKCITLMLKYELWQVSEALQDILNIFFK